MSADTIRVDCIQCHLGLAHGCDGPSDWTADDVLELAESAHQSEHGLRMAMLKIARLEKTVASQEILLRVRPASARVAS